MSHHFKNLDPENWDHFRSLSHEALDDILDFVQTIRAQPVWQAPPPHIRESFQTPLPQDPRPLEDVLWEVKNHIFPYTSGNVHPLFMGWAQGAGTPLGILAEMISAGLNVNCGGRQHIAADIERQIGRYMSELLDFPKDSLGIFTTGASMANIIATLIARTHKLGVSSRKRGVPSQTLVAYTSEQTHICVTQAMEIAGLGSDFLRKIPTNAEGKISLVHLEEAVEHDMAQGLHPFLLIGTAGAINMGAIDDLSALAKMAHRYHMWFHVDGAFGALLSLSDDLKPLLAGIEQADSVAMDFHKWLQVPYDAGFLLVRHPEIQRDTFASTTAYLERTSEGLSGGDFWPCDYGPDLSRGFRALKTWMTFQTFGRKQLAAILEQSCELAHYLSQCLQRSHFFELHLPQHLNIVCFKIKGEVEEALTKRLVIALQESGKAAPSLTKWGGKTYIRCAIFNHRTQKEDMDHFVRDLEEIYLRTIQEKRKEPLK